MKLRYTILKSLINAMKLTDDNKIESAVEAINLVVKINDDHNKAIAEEVEKGVFAPINGIDWNVWAYDTEDDIKEIYNFLTDLYHERHFELYGFTSIAV